MYKIYRYESPCQKYYIGMTRQTLAERARRNGIGYKGSVKFYNAIKYWGFENFAVEILYECESYEEACEAEKHYIKLYKTQDDRYGYNIHEGGDFYGAKYDEEHNMKLQREIAKTLGRHVLCIETGIEYPSANEAARQLGYKTGNRISACARGEAKSAYGYTWRYTSEPVVLQSKYGTGRPIRCVETGAVFSCAGEACYKMGINRASISHHLHGHKKYQTCGGYHWEYCEEGD